jgi:hypothetical protein
MGRRLVSLTVHNRLGRGGAEWDPDRSSKRGKVLDNNDAGRGRLVVLFLLIRLGLGMLVGIVGYLCNCILCRIVFCKYVKQLY